MGKIKKEKTSELDDTKEIKDEDTYEEKLQYASAIAKPMAPKKLTKKCYKLIKKGGCALSYCLNDGIPKQ